MPDRPRSSIDHDQLDVLLTFVQDGVASRRQLLDLGATDDDIERMVRRGRLHRRHPGVYVNHNGPLTRQQREWVAVQVHWPAALTRQSALPAPPPLAVVHVAISDRRTVKPVTGVVAHRTAGIGRPADPDPVAARAARVDWRRAPPRMRLEHVAIDLASAVVRDDPLEAFRVLADATQTRQTSAAEIAQALHGRRVQGQRLLLEMLDDLATGACSVLEREYLHAVERAHGLPDGQRQKPATAAGRSAYRDVEYVDLGLIVELDGRAFHDNASARDADAGRDLEAKVAQDATTVRLTYGLVFGSPCWTAGQVAALLQRQGWHGRLARCPRCP
ncbi:type IV toxin-antitoxin system AbiEi family antitoxin domain-containing protein [Nocardioides plantarum]|uniref:Type IV toxin-antitoxin system AbiEi family antitoxin domain-containing protein n=1 Tax=Nocardioides plantarum TaxID=29299 RepID=A0ABV5KB27_9ACTN|nr:type IV toxin-antitoxin system AbiEi family antitoxin domain-containing protein [Nocardioides plantarum]